jgi:hypothetical protein
MNFRAPYQIPLRLYPRDYRSLFAAEMLMVFEEMARERRRRGAAALVRFTLGEMLGLVAGAAAEWIAKLAYSVCHTNSYVAGHGGRDILRMRPAGVSWESFYGSESASAKAARGVNSIVCVNAQQTFALGSHFRRLLMFASKGSCPCALWEPEASTDGLERSD